MISVFFHNFSGFMWSTWMIVLLMGLHIFLTIRLRVPQRHILSGIRLSLNGSKGDGDVSSFSALMTGLAATIGTGNIVGVATAVALGGPGAVLWCWLTGVLGIATKYAEGYLAVRYRHKTRRGQMIGGPMYALQRGLGMRWAAVFFAVATVLASFGIGCTVQANAVSTSLAEIASVPEYVSGAVMALLVMAVVCFGVKGIAGVCRVLVPAMALLYILSCVILLIYHYDYVIPAIKAIASGAFGAESVAGGAAGGGIMLAARYGIARGLFSNESGMGSAPIVAAAAKTTDPHQQGLISMTATFWDTVVICAMTGIVCVIAMLQNGAPQSGEMLLTHQAFSSLPIIGPVLLTIGLITFAFSTILGWSYYGERAAEYMFSRPSRKGAYRNPNVAIYVYRVLWVVFVYVGATVSLQTVWDAADCMNALMVLPNALCLVLLSKKIKP